MYFKKLNFNKNELINEVLTNYYGTVQVTLDTGDFVPAKYNDKIQKYIFKNLKKQFKKIDKEDKAFQKEYIKELIETYKEKETQKGFFSRLFKRKSKITETANEENSSSEENDFSEQTNS